MSTTVSAGSSATFEIGPFDTITLTSSAGRGTLTLTSQAPKLVADQSLSVQNGTFGPYGAPMSVSMAVAAGSATYEVNTRSLTATDAAAAAALVSADREVPRAHDITHKLSGDFGTLSFSRSSANASVIDYYGSMQFALSGEARFQGARRVCNLVVDSEGFTTGWDALGANTTKTLQTAMACPKHARRSAYYVVRTSGGATMMTLTALSLRPGKYVFSVWIIGDGTQTYTLAIGATTQTVTPAVGVWTRVAVAADITSTTAVACSITNTTSGAASFYVCNAQLEWANGQASPAPGEYVPRGVSTSSLPASVYTYEAGVDGVRYFKDGNPWALSSGVATELFTSTPLDPASLLGLLTEPAATNQIYSSGDMSAAQWSKTGSTTVNATAIDSTALGKLSLWKIQEAGINEGHRVTQSWRGTVPAVNTILSASAHFKAAERTIVYIGVRALDGSTIRYAFFNLLTGVVGPVQGSGVAYMYRVGDTWRCCYSVTAGSTGSTAPLMSLGCCQVAGTENDLGTLNSGVYVGAAQFETAAVPSSYVGDTASGATLSRSQDVWSVVSTDMPAIGWTFSVDYTPMFPTNTALKDTWWYIASTYVSAADRGAIGMRPAALGGFYDGGEGQIFWDLYPGISADNLNWDGVEVLTGYAGRAGETVRVQWSAATTAQTGASNQAGSIGAVAATATGDAPRRAVNSWATTPRTWTFGRQSTSSGQRGPACFKNLSWTPTARTAAEMLAAA